MKQDSLFDILQREDLDFNKRKECIKVYIEARKRYDDNNVHPLIASNFCEHMEKRHNYSVGMVNVYLNEL